LEVIRRDGEFVDRESGVWLDDYFEYKEYIRRWREENPGEMLDIDEVGVG
jgi:hypothetical protein